MRNHDESNSERSSAVASKFMDCSKRDKRRSVIAMQFFLSAFCVPTRVDLHRKSWKYLFSGLRAQRSYRKFSNFVGVDTGMSLGWYKLRDDLCISKIDQFAAPETNKDQLVSRLSCTIHRLRTFGSNDLIFKIRRTWIKFQLKTLF